MPFEQPKFEKPPEVEAKKEKKISPEEEKVRVLKDYIALNYKRKSVPENEIQKEKEILLGLEPSKFKKFFGRQDFNFIYDGILKVNNLENEISKSGLKKEEVEQFIKEKGKTLLPLRIREAFWKLSMIQEDFSETLNTMVNMKLEGKRCSLWKKFKLLGTLANDFQVIKKEIKEWQKYSKFEREKEEKPMKIKGFEKFDCKNIKGEEIIKKAAEILPRGLLSINLRSIEYQDKPEVSDSTLYGFEGLTYTGIARGRKKDRIIFFQLPGWSRENYLSYFPYSLAHEFGHSLDPKRKEQKDLSPAEQFRMIVEWEKIRREEPEFSNYVKKINNKNKELEEYLKSEESFAESIGYFLTNPYFLEDTAPQRYKFCLSWLKKRFPEVDLKKILEKNLEYDRLISSLSFKKKEK